MAVRKLALRCTPRAITYMNDFKLYALVTSASIPWKDFEIDETDSHARALYRFRKEKAKSEGNIVQQFAIRLLVPVRSKRAWQKAVEPGEHILVHKERTNSRPVYGCATLYACYWYRHTWWRRYPVSRTNLTLCNHVGTLATACSMERRTEMRENRQKWRVRQLNLSMGH